MGISVRNFPAKECGGKHAPYGKSVFFWKQKMDINASHVFVAKNPTNLDRNICDANEDFETNEYRKVMGIIAIR